MSITVKPVYPEDIAEKSGKTPEEAKKILELVKRSMQPCQKRIDVLEGGLKRFYAVERRGIGLLKTAYGNFWQYGFTIDDQWEKYSVLVKAELDLVTLNPVFKGKDEFLLRTDSGCETGQVFGDMTCDCRGQLKLAMETIKAAPEGMIVNIPRQDGRGMGLPFKLATLWLQTELKVDTVESASLLAPGGVIDIRTYAGVICIMKYFEIPTSCVINLASNNPEKKPIFSENGYKVAENMVPMVIEANEYTRQHFQAKEIHLNHIGLTGKKSEGVNGC